MRCFYFLCRARTGLMNETIEEKGVAIKSDGFPSKEKIIKTFEESLPYDVDSGFTDFTILWFHEFFRREDFESFIGHENSEHQGTFG